MTRIRRRARPGACVGLTIVALVSPAALSAQVWEVGNKLLQLGTPQDGAYFGAAIATGDFDGDGVQDLVVGAPLWDSATGTNNGLWRVYLGSRSRTLNAVLTSAESGTDGQWGGFALAAGDFDGDGRAEIAIGEPEADISPTTSAGRVRILGYNAGIWSYQGPISQDDAPLTGPEQGDQFGYSLAVGNFNGDAYADLAVGAPFEDWNSDVDAGVVHVFYGSATGLRTDNPVTFHALEEAPGEEFGRALAAGDFNADGYQDLAVGIPLRAVSISDSAGGIEVFYGSAAGIPESGAVPTGASQTLDDASFPGHAADAYEFFGDALAAGQFDQSVLFCVLFSSPCYADLAIGVPGQVRSTDYGVGKVMVAYGSASGLSTSSYTDLEQSALGAGAAREDYFGQTLAAGYQSWNFFGPQDLAVDAPGKDPYAFEDGEVDLVFGDFSGLNAGQSAQLLPQKPGFKVAPANDSDQFGQALAIADLDGDGWGDLVVGVPAKGTSDSGAVEVLYGALFADGFESSGTASWSATTP